MIRDHDPIVTGFLQHPGSLVHVEVTVVDEGLHEVGQRLVHVSIMYLENLALLAEMAERVLYVPSHQRTAFEPAPDTEAEPYVRAVGDFHGAVVSVETAEDAAGYAAEFRLGRIVRMDADADSRFFGDRGDLPDKGGEVVPNLVLAVHPPVGQRHLKQPAAPVPFPGLRQVEPPGRRPAAGVFPFRAPDSIPHVSVGRIRYARLAHIAYVALVLRHFRIPVRQVEHDGVLVVHVAVSETVDLDPGFLVYFPTAHEVIVVGMGAVRP